jgi:thiol:disulfide interchange protein DsbC
MKKIIFLCLIFLGTNTIYANEDVIRLKLKNILPAGSVIESIEISNFEGIYKVYYGDLQPIYVSKDGEFFIYGDMYKIIDSKISNITNEEIKGRRVKILNTMNDDQFISFKSKNELSSITIFTDVDCGYCRKLHNQIAEYNKLGISIKYAAFPRSGLGTQAFSKMVGAWCSQNPKATLTDLKNDKKVNLSFCSDQPVAKHYAIGQKLGVTGTPAIFTSDGDLLPGYLPPEELAEKLKI